MEMITSRHNPLVKAVRALRSTKLRRSEGRFLVEGVRLLEEALAAGLNLEAVLVCPELAVGTRAQALLTRLRESGVRWVPVSASVLASVAETETPQGLVAVASLPGPPSVSALLEATDLVVLGEGIQDPGNAGTLIRAAEAAGAGGVCFSAGSVYPFGGKVVRASMGSLFRLPVVALGDNGKELAASCRAAGWEVVVTTPAGGTPFWQVAMAAPTLVVLGNEGAGVSAELTALGSQRAFIPLAQPVESLNVAVAGAIILFEAVRQRAARRKAAAEL